MDFNDPVRVRHPHSDIEHRLGSIIAITRPEHGAPGGDTIYHVQFPGGTCRRYTASALKPCTPDDDRAAILGSVTAVFHTLRGTIRRALDYDSALTADLTDLLAATTHTLHEHFDLDPDSLVRKKTGRRNAPSAAERPQPARGRWTHGRSLVHPGPVCGTNEQDPLITDDPARVNCQECPDAADLEAIPEDAAEGDPRVIDLLREAQQGHTRKIGGVIVDATTAGAILAVYDAASPKTQKKIATLPITMMASLAWNALRSAT